MSPQKYLQQSRFPSALSGARVCEGAVWRSAVGPGTRAVCVALADLGAAATPRSLNLELQVPSATLKITGKRFRKGRTRSARGLPAVPWAPAQGTVPAQHFLIIQTRPSTRGSPPAHGAGALLQRRAEAGRPCVCSARAHRNRRKSVRAGLNFSARAPLLRRQCLRPRWRSAPPPLSILRLSLCRPERAGPSPRPR